MKDPHYRVSIEELTDVDALAQHWESLETSSNCTFFLTWHWVGTWLAVFDPKVRVLKIHYQERLVGLALLVLRAEHRNIFIRSRVLRMHQIGELLDDQIWIEYNGLLLHKDHEPEATTAAMDYLVTQDHSWDELVVGAITGCARRRMQQEQPLADVVQWETSTYGVNLAAIRASGVDYLDTLSRNTRYQIGRSMRLYENAGNFEMTLATSYEQALEYFKQTGPLHLKRWGSKLGESGFASEKFCSFHRSLIERCFATHNIDIWKMTVAGEAVAYFYNLNHRGNIYFYLSGIRSVESKHHKPGLLGHAQMISYYMQRGDKYYDFMGGDERYKASLAQPGERLYKVALQRHKLRFRFEQQARRLKRLVVHET